jgi:RNA polymerase sigma-70 factor (ECF subfamily)
MTQKEFLDKVLPFKDKVYRLAKRLLVSGDEAEDATQELYLKLWKNKESLEGYKNMEAFAMTMTKNYCLDQLKSRRASNLMLVHSNYANPESLQKNIEVKDDAGLMLQLIDELPQKQRLVIQLRDVENYDFDEIGEILEMEQTAIRVTLSRARKTLREKFIKKQQYGMA